MDDINIIGNLLPPSPPQKIINSSYGYFDEKYIPKLISDSPLRNLAGCIIVLVILFIIAYTTLLYHNKREMLKLLIKDKPMLKMILSAEQKLAQAILPAQTIDILIPGIFGRYIYIYGIPDEKLKIKNIQINDQTTSSIPMKITFTTEENELPLCKVELIDELLIRTIKITSDSMLSRILIRDNNGSKLFEYI